jgi:alkylhydroperoxidase/carboxymuconolactone decarboxylase family protein YurZ
MDNKITAILTVIFVTTFSFTTISEALNMDKNQALSAKQQGIIPIAAFTANGDMEKLKSAVIDTFLKEHLFADIFARDNLDYQSRELATISALASMTGTEGQLRFHLGAAMNTGLTEAQMTDFISVLEAKVGKTEAESAREVLTTVLNIRK